MATINYQDFQRSQAERANNMNGPKRIPFFSLKNDGDEAVVRFAYSSPSEFDLMTVHSVSEGNRFLRVNCPRTPHDPLHMCPLCEAGVQLQNKFFIKLIEYVRDENGAIRAVPRIWERTARYATEIGNLLNEYGDLRKCVFKIKRSGAKGSVNTVYNILYGNPSIYKPEIYIEDFSAFDGYNLIGTTVLEKSYNELCEYAAKPSTGWTPNTTPAAGVQAQPAPVATQVFQPATTMQAPQTVMQAPQTVAYTPSTPEIYVPSSNVGVASAPGGFVDSNMSAVTPSVPSTVPGMTGTTAVNRVPASNFNQAPTNQSAVNTTPADNRPRRYTY